MTKQPTMDITQSINRHYPVLKDLMTEEEFRSFLNDEGFEVSKQCFAIIDLEIRSSPTLEKEATFTTPCTSINKY